MGDDSLQIIILIILIAMSAFFSATETAFTCVNRTRIMTLAQDGNKKAKSIMFVCDNYDKFLSTTLVGNNIVNIAASSIATIAFTRWLNGSNELGATVSTVVMTILILVFGEISPKSLAKDFSEEWTMKAVGIVRFLMVVLTPITFAFSLWKALLAKIFKKADAATVTEDEIITMVDEAQNDGEIDEHEGELIRNAIDFGDLEVSEILKPRVDIVAVPVDMPFENIMKTFKSSGFSRLPVYDDTIDNIIGIIHEKDFGRFLHEGRKNIKSIINKPLFITESTKISKLLRKLQSEKTHIAIVVDEYGGTAGLVTLEDVLEILVGEIWDEHDKVVPDYKEIGEDTYIVNGTSSLMDIEDIYVFPEETYDDNVTVNGWVLENLQKMPEVGDTFDFANLTVEVLEVKDRRAEKVKLTVNKIESDEEENDADNGENLTDSSDGDDKKRSDEDDDGALLADAVSAK